MTDNHYIFRLHFQNVRQIIYKEVKRPGKNHEKLLQMLRDELRGPKHVRRDYIQEVSEKIHHIIIMIM